MYNKAKLITLIKDFIGPNGRLPFEHGFRPDIGVTEVTEHSAIFIGYSEIPFEDMNEGMLTNLIFTIFEYQNYCHLKA